MRSRAAAALAVLSLVGTITPASAEVTIAADGESRRVWAYQPAGRRDPFLRPGGLGAQPGHGTCSGRGAEAQLIGDLSLRGIVRTPRGAVALVMDPEQSSHFLRVGDHLCDGHVAAIGSDSVSYLQQSEDPLRKEAGTLVVRELHPR